MLAASLLVLSVCLEPLVSGHYALPTIRYADLESATNQALEQLKDDGGRISAFAVTDLPLADYGSHVSAMQSSAPSCIGGDATLPVIDLAGGAATRKTYATEEDAYPDCMGSAAAAVSGVFGLVGGQVSGLIEAAAGREIHFTRPEGIMHRLEEAPHKDHIHLYETKTDLNNNSLAKTALVPEHIDNGLFLIITPFPEQSLVVRTSTGRAVPTSHLDPADSVLVLVGVALTDWLLQADADTGRQFFPSPHSVPYSESAPGQRTVFARMAVAPGNAIPVTPGRRDADLVSFDEVFAGTERRQPVVASLDTNRLCSVDLLAAALYRMAVNDLCQAEGTAYCWHDCLDIPQNCTQDIIDSDGVYCMDVVSQELCDPSLHNPNCQLFCPEPIQTTTVSDIGDTTEDTVGSGGDVAEEPFCNGIPIGMYMTGFEFAGNPRSQCIMLFFREWTLDTRGKFIAGCVGVAVMGVFIEALIATRRELTKASKQASATEKKWIYKAVILLVFALTLSLGYLAMLVAMTYSVELFLSIVAGLVAGHGIFNVGAPVGETVDPCCASQNSAAPPPVNNNEKASVIQMKELGEFGTEEGVRQECCKG